MAYLVDIKKVNDLIISKGYENKKLLLDKMVDIQSSSFYNLLNGKSKYRTTINLVMRLSKALDVTVEEIIIDDDSIFTKVVKSKERL